MFFKSHYQVASGSLLTRSRLRHVVITDCEELSSSALHF